MPARMLGFSAAASAAMSERSARKWQRGSLPSESKKARRRWISRPDPFADVWESDVVPLLRTDPDGELSGTTILEWMLLYLSRGLFEYRSRFPDGGVDLPGNVALETADDVALRHSLGDSSAHVCLGPGVMRQSDKDDSIQSGIGLTIASAV